MQEIQETRGRSLGWEDLLEEEMATHSSILALEIPWTEESCRLQSQSVRKNFSNLAHYGQPYTLSQGLWYCTKRRYYPPLRVMDIKTKINKWDLIKRKSFCTAKETINKVKRQASELEKITANEITDKGFISKVCKQLI